ncbi:FAD-dependent oxidoreductase [Acrocarpospora sp. B8E8]|uniref:FAD-dependent oxidoreductase n=1 Tax=Acrocarpospora sp. B8E8 TaxID=3153572 RepID=UPI00325DB09F
MRLLIIGGSDAGIEAGLGAKAFDENAEVTLLVADRYPNYSICGIPYYVSGEVTQAENLAHRTQEELTAAGLHLRLGQRAVSIDPAEHTVTTQAGQQLSYDRLVIGTGAKPQRPPISGLDLLGPHDGVFELHTMADTFALTSMLGQPQMRSAIIIGAGYIGLEMAEALSARGLQVTVLERLDQVMARSLDAEAAGHLAAELSRHGVDLHCGVTVDSLGRDGTRLLVTGTDGHRRSADLVLVVTGVTPDTQIAAAAGALTGAGQALAVDRRMRTNLPDVYAAGDCVETYHRLLDRTTYIPLGTTAHKQGRVAGENAAGGDRVFAGVLGTQVVKVFDLVSTATGIRDQEALRAGFSPLTTQATADDHKAYYPGATPVHMRLTGDRSSQRLLGAQIIGSRGAEIAKRIDVLATGIHHGITVREILDLDLAYTPPLGSPWDALQQAARQWLVTTGSAGSAAGGQGTALAAGSTARR